jgi:hypothetical protein
MAPMPSDRINPYSFGLGGGGFSANIINSLLPIMNFDYMGAAEYEFGAVPKSISAMMEMTGDKEIAQSVIQIDARKIKVYDPGLSPFEGSSAVYIIGSMDNINEIETRVKLIIEDEENLSRYSRKESSGIMLRDYCGAGKEIRDGWKENDARSSISWLELDNGFFFSIDKNMTDSFMQWLARS